MALSIRKAADKLREALRCPEGKSPFDGPDGKSVEKLAHELLHESLDDPRPVLLAAQVVARDRFIHGLFPGIPAECKNSGAGAALTVMLQHCMADGGVDPAVYLHYKNNSEEYDICGGCLQGCTEQRDPDLQLSPEDVYGDQLQHSSPRFFD